MVSQFRPRPASTMGMTPHIFFSQTQEKDIFEITFVFLPELKCSSNEKWNCLRVKKTWGSSCLYICIKYFTLKTDSSKIHPSVLKLFMKQQVANVWVKTTNPFFQWINIPVIHCCTIKHHKIQWLNITIYSALSQFCALTGHSWSILWYSQEIAIKVLVQSHG